MGHKVFYKGSVEKDLRRVENKERIKIVQTLEAGLSENPIQGKKLKGKFRELRSLRIGNYRVIYTMITEGILVLRIAHRKDVYREE